MMTISELEFILFLGFSVMTFLYFKIKAEMYAHKRMTAKIFMCIAEGKMEVKETEEGFDIVAVGK